jgi:hypothetical protein
MQMEPELDKYSFPLNTVEQRELFEELWRQHYDRLHEVLSRHGKEWNPGTCEGDFLLVDTAYQCRLQKVEVMNVPYVTPELVRDVQASLVDLNSNWGVMFSLWLDNPQLRENARGFIVSRNAVEEHWDWDALKARFGASLKWPKDWHKQQG